MKQQINLYQDIFRPQKLPLSASQISVLVGLFLFIFVVSYAYKWYEVDALYKELAATEQQSKKLVGDIDKLSSQYPVQAKSRLLETEIARLDRELEQRNAISRALTHHSLENKKAFSTLLESLARKHVDGTWLTSVSITDGGRSLGFAGKTYSSELVPVYIQQLADESSFSNLSFNVLQLNRSLDDPASLDFQVSTRAERL
ncbi:MAG: hypothetical protein GKR93_16920 [Gammaproteobacteria bacterium]|nr:hypothetical protein [Gammaproteobacteria bacterium]